MSSAFVILVSNAPKIFTHSNKLSRGQKRRMKKQQKRQQELLEQEFEELEEMECREQEQRLKELGLLCPPAEGDTPSTDQLKSSESRIETAVASEVESSALNVPSGQDPVPKFRFSCASHSHSLS